MKKYENLVAGYNTALRIPPATSTTTLRGEELKYLVTAGLPDHVTVLLYEYQYGGLRASRVNQGLFISFRFVILSQTFCIYNI